MVVPSLSTLRAFEAVGRRLSFSAAASELRISQSSVSRHIALLESEVGRRLLDRTTRQCSLTAAGRELHAGITAGLRQIEASVVEARDGSDEDEIAVSVSPFLSVVWFTPLLLQFIQRNAGASIRLHHSYDPPTFDDDGIDLGVNWGTRPPSAGLVSEIIVDGSLVPACSPGYAQRHVRANDPTSLLRCQLMHEFRSADWQAWFAAQGTRAQPVTSRQISDTGALRNAAIAGHGVALLFDRLIDEDVDAGRLVRPFPHPVHVGEDYWLSYRRDRARLKPLQSLVRWLRRHARTARLV